MRRNTMSIILAIAAVVVALLVVLSNSAQAATVERCQWGTVDVVIDNEAFGIAKVTFDTPFASDPVVVVTARQVINRITWQAIGHPTYAKFVGRLEDAGSGRETVQLNWVACGTMGNTLFGRLR